MANPGTTVEDKGVNAGRGLPRAHQQHPPEQLTVSSKPHDLAHKDTGKDPCGWHGYMVAMYNDVGHVQKAPALIYQKASS